MFLAILQLFTGFYIRFLKGDDNKDYMFHINDFSEHVEIIDGQLIDFEPTANAKGYKAIKCRLLDRSTIDTYIIPTTIELSKGDYFKDMEILQKSDWKAYVSSSDSPDTAKNLMKQKIKQLGANAIINLEYSKTTGSNGNYQYSIHNYSGNIVLIGKRSKNGDVKQENIPDLNKNAQEYKDLKEKEYNDSESNTWLFLLAFFATLSIIAGIISSKNDLFPILEIGVIILTVLIKLFITNENEADWLIKK